MAKRVLAVDAARIQRLGHSWSALADGATVQGGLLSRAQACAADSTAADDRLRSYVGALETASAAMSAAYARAAANAPRVAEAIEAATAAQQAVEPAVAGLAYADGAVRSAEADVVSANVTVATHRAAGAISILIGMSMAPSPAQFAALAHAEHRLVQAEHKRDAANWVLHNAEQSLAKADQERHRGLRAFAATCRAEAELARRTVPAKPRWRVDTAEVNALADGLAALASVAAGQSLAIERFAQGDAGATAGALEIVDRWAKRLERFGRAGEFAGPVIDAAVEAFAYQDAVAPDGRPVNAEMRRAGAP